MRTPLMVRSGPVYHCLKKYKKIYIEITNRCNLACSFCHQSQRPKAEMTRATFAAIIDRVKEYTDHLSLHVLGEPLLHPDLEQFLAICHQHRLRVNLTTNGTLLPRCRKILTASPALRQLNISLHSFAEQGERANLNEYLAEILGIVRRLTADTETYVSLRLWNEAPTKINDSSTDLHNPMHAALEEYFDLPIRLNQIPGGRGIAMAPKIYLSRAEGFTWPHQPGPDQGERGTCRGLKDHIAILVDGTVVPCCLDGEGDIALGNIISEPLPEILSSPRATAMRLAATRQLLVEQLCRRCTYRKRFEHASAPESIDHAFLAADNECSAPLRGYGR